MDALDKFISLIRQQAPDIRSDVQKLGYGSIEYQLRLDVHEGKIKKVLFIEQNRTTRIQVG